MRQARWSPREHPQQGAFTPAASLPAGFARRPWLPPLTPEWRLLVVTGFLGALTTFSSFSAEMFINLQAGRWGLALGGIAAHVVGSLCMTGLGLGMVALARQLLTR